MIKDSNSKKLNTVDMNNGLIVLFSIRTVNADY